MDQIKLADHVKANYDDYYTDADAEWRRLGAIGKADNIVALCSDLQRDAVLEIGALDSLARLHRVHERHLRVRIAGRDELDFSFGSDVEPAKAGSVDGVERPRRRVRLYCVEDFARKVIPEPSSRYRNPRRTHTGDRHFWESFPDQVQGRLEREQFTYTPVSLLNPIRR